MKRQEKEELLNKIKELQEQVDNATIENENPFDVEDRERAYYLDHCFIMSESYHWNSEELKDYIPCKDIKISQELANQAKLNTLLTKFAYDNDAVVTEKTIEDIFPSFITYDTRIKQYNVKKNYSFDKELFTVYFKDEEIAQRAIDEVVIPFMESIND